MIPVSYSYRSLMVRWKTTLMTATGFTLVIAALIVMLAFINGLAEVCAISGDPNNVIVLNEGCTDEILSSISRATASQIETNPLVVRRPDGTSLSSRELFGVRTVYDKKIRDYVLMPFRGVSPSAFEVHNTVHVVSGRTFRPSQSEVIVGMSIKNAQKVELGDVLEIARKKWKVAGFFAAGGAALESEVWGDLDEMAGQFKKEGSYNSIVVRAESPARAKDLARSIDSSAQISVGAQTELDYYAKQAESTNFLRSAVWVIAWFMGIGAIFGVMNTMFAAISQRIKDIAVLRLLGFMSWEILIAFLLEAIMVSLIGGGLGMLVGYSANGFTQRFTISGHEVQFRFLVDASLLALAAAFSLIMGIMGGLLPAMSAMRVRPLEAFR
ncbi:ABC transporter permease [bacterium]|jgi:putative ABC transport system permease protein|nr:ABC transporter permease [bacterium]